jgi:hypothetical protein
MNTDREKRITTMSKQIYRRSSEILSQKGSSYLLLLCIVRGVVKKHGGSMKIDEKTNTVVLGIPQSKKANCFKELEEVIGPVDTLSLH